MFQVKYKAELSIKSQDHQGYIARSYPKKKKEEKFKMVMAVSTLGATEPVQGG